MMKKRNDIMYLLARLGGARDFYVTDDTLLEEAFSKEPMYVRHHRAKISVEKQMPKHIIYEEYGATIGSQVARMQGMRDIDQGRKAGVISSFVGQSEDQFGEVMIKKASNVFILKFDGEEQMAARKQMHGISDDVIDLARRHMVSPGIMLHISQLKGIKTIQVVRLVIGRANLWAFSSTNEDILIRNELTERSDFYTAIGHLARHFPDGSMNEYHLTYQDRLIKSSHDGAQKADNWQKHLATALLEGGALPDAGLIE